jgi:ribonuclease J
MTMRRRLSREGVVITVLDAKNRPTVEGIGLPLDEDYDAFVEECQRDVAQAIGRLKGRDRKDDRAIHEAARLATRRAATRWSGKRPQVKVIQLAS